MSFYDPRTWFITQDTLQLLYNLLTREIQSATASCLKELAQTNLDILKLAEQIDGLEGELKAELDLLKQEVRETNGLIVKLLKRPEPEPVAKLLAALVSGLDGAQLEISKKLGEVRADAGSLMRLQISNTNIAAETLQVLKKAIGPIGGPLT